MADLLIGYFFWWGVFGGEGARECCGLASLACNALGCRRYLGLRGGWGFPGL